jgi:hypothetical protein
MRRSQRAAAAVVAVAHSQAESHSDSEHCVQPYPLNVDSLRVHDHSLRTIVLTCFRFTHRLEIVTLSLQNQTVSF